MSERQRNTKAHRCYVCGTAIQPGEGWLYVNTEGRNYHLPAHMRSKRAKCDACHRAGKTKGNG